MDILSPSEFFFAMMGGLLPALLWLWFWLKEDCHPEPRKMIIQVFIAGMFSTTVALGIEHLFFKAEELMGIEKTTVGVFVLLFAWAAIEEIVKYFMAKKVAFSSLEFDEPVDALIYMITIALGFTAMENIFFLAKALKINFMMGFMTGHLRFLGSSLLHVASSGIVGTGIAYSFYKKKNLKRNLTIGLILSTILHFAFNYFIMKIGIGSSANEEMFRIFISLWTVIILLIFIFEKVKKLRSSNITN